MAYDLVIGATRRDWSCGQSPPPSAPAARPADPRLLGEEARARVAGAASLAARLSRSGRLPPADRDVAARFYQKWTAFWSSRRGRFSRADVPRLLAFREAAGGLRARLEKFEEIARTPVRTSPKSPSAATALSPSPPRATLWAVLAGAAAALLGVGVYRAAKLT